MQKIGTLTHCFWGRQIDFIFLKIYLERHTKNFKMVLNFWWDNNTPGNLSVGILQMRTGSIHKHSLGSVTHNTRTNKRKAPQCSIEQGWSGTHTRWVWGNHERSYCQRKFNHTGKCCRFILKIEIWVKTLKCNIHILNLILWLK